MDEYRMGPRKLIDFNFREIAGNTTNVDQINEFLEDEVEKEGLTPTTLE